MAESIRAVTWEAPEHHHIEKGNDWFWGLGIVAFAGIVAAVAFGNFLFGVLLLLAVSTMFAVALQKPQILHYGVMTRGIRVGESLYPYSSLESFHIDEENPRGPQLIVKSQRLFMSLIIMPVPEEYVDEIDELIGARLPEEELEEPFAHKLLEFFGF
jgi:hypothetical protein